MTNQQLDNNRFSIVKNYFEYFNILDLENDLSISVACSKDGIYHVFGKKEKELTHLYSMSDPGLEKLSKSLKIETIKVILIDTQLKAYEQKLIDRNNGINPMDFENMY